MAGKRVLSDAVPAVFPLFATKKAKREITTGAWTKYKGSLLVGDYGTPEASRKIAAFDLDGTIICTKSGKRFPTDKNDFRLLYPTIPAKLQELHEKGYKIVIISNQLGISKGHLSEGDFKHRASAVVAEMDVPVYVFAATTEDRFRKPRVGMWEALTEAFNDSIEIDPVGSMYCGDMAGRTEGWRPKAKKDALDTDRKFALNAGLQFFTPEELFLGERPAPYKLSGFDPRQVKSGDLTDPAQAVIANEARQEMILMVGSPASGKSTFAKRHLVPHGYVYINQDTLKTAQKCISEAERALASGKSVVVDNTNPEPSSRARYIALARSANVPARCMLLNHSKELCIHNNTYRSVYGSGVKVPTMVIHAYFKKFVKPALSEGLEEIVQVNFVPEFGGDEKAERYFRMFVS